jgi:peroxiredoxin
MSPNDRRAPVGAGEPAPDFTLPAAHADGTIALAQYRGQDPVLVALFRGLY